MSRGPLVVAISGTSGAGKSRLIERLVAALPGSISLHFDDHVTLGSDPAEIEAWVAEGAPPHRIIAPELLRAVRHHRALGTAPALFVEEPFGRTRPELAGEIDLALHLDLPPDLALARRMLRALELETPSADIAEQLHAFLGAGRAAYRATDAAAREAADRVLDGTDPPDTLAAAALAVIAARLDKDMAA